MQNLFEKNFIQRSLINKNMERKNFAPNLNAKELGIKIDRKFVFNSKLARHDFFIYGDILELLEDDQSINPWFKKASDKESHVCAWSDLAYLDEEEKTWDNLEVGWSLVTPNGGTREILAICDRLIFIEKHSGDCYPYGHTKEYFMGAGYKIKGASEEKPSIQSVIELLERTDYAILSFGKITDIKKAIEMLKKLK